MRMLGHHCVRVIPEHPSTANCDLVCSCGAAFAGSYCDAVDAFTAHVVAHIAASALDRERVPRSVIDTAKGVFRERRRGI